MKRTSAVKDTFTVEDVYKRASATLEQCLLNGVMHMRTHVEVDPNVGLRGLEAIERLAKDFAWGIDLQICGVPADLEVDAPCEILRETLDRFETAQPDVGIDFDMRAHVHDAVQQALLERRARRL